MQIYSFKFERCIPLLIICLSGGNKIAMHNNNNKLNIITLTSIVALGACGSGGDDGVQPLPIVTPKANSAPIHNGNITHTVFYNK